MLISPIILLFFAMFGLFLTVLTISIIRNRRRRQNRKPIIPRCPCGYALVALTLPRCPECGRLVGFNQTAADLGISESEMRTHAARKSNPS